MSRSAATQTTSSVGTRRGCSCGAVAASSSPGSSSNGKQARPAPRQAAASTATVILTQADLAGAGEASLDAMTMDGGNALSLTSPAHVFDCSDESMFYSQCIEKLVLRRPDCPDSLIEFGAGDGRPVLSSLLKTPPANKQQQLIIHAYEIGPSAAALAAHHAAASGLGDTYRVHNSCFWRGVKETPATCLISNPPYIPSPDADLLMPALWGGVDGAELTRDLLSLGFQKAMLMISAYSNPVATLQHARQQGYVVTDFLVTPLPWGRYSSEPKVKQWIEGLRRRGEAFYSHRLYFLAGVLFEKGQGGAAHAAAANGSSNGRQVAVAAAAENDMYDELLRVLTAL